jgi:hypothetical protein
MSTLNITISQGDHLGLEWLVTGDVSAGTFRFRVRKPGATAHALSEAVTVGSYSNPTTPLTLTLATTDTLLAVGEYAWSLARTDTDNEETVAKGRFVVESTADLP